GVWDVLSNEVLAGLSPLVTMGLGWIGFLFGFQFENKYLQKFPIKYYSFSFLQFLIMFILVMLIIFPLLKNMYFLERPFHLLGFSIALALLSTLNSPTLLSAVLFQMPRKSMSAYLSRFIVSVSGFWGLLGLALLSSFWNISLGQNHQTGTGITRLVLATFLPVLLAFLFSFLTRNKSSPQELLVYVIGLVFFCSGLASSFNLPPLYCGMVLGIVYTNLSKIQEKLYPLLISTEKPMFVVFLILIGAMWRIYWDEKVVVLILLLITLRFLISVLPVAGLAKLLRFPFPYTPEFGFFFISSGGMGIAFTISIALMIEHTLIPVFMSAAIFTILVLELFSPWAIRKALNKMDSMEKAE
ncbi:MAG: hypothetical protein ACOC57_07385, partial [Acidobacteriota bacterium]